MIPNKLKSLWGQAAYRPAVLLGIVMGIVMTCAIVGEFVSRINNARLWDTPRRTVDPNSWKCLPVPASFSAADLVGTWQVNKKAVAQVETLKLRENGTYQQIFSDYSQGYFFGGQWSKWEVDFRPNGGVYIRLSGWKYCLLERACGEETGDEEPHGAIGFFELCEERDFHPGNDMILAVAGYDPRSGIPRPPHGIVLIHPRPLGAESSPATYTLLDEPEP